MGFIVQIKTDKLKKKIEKITNVGKGEVTGKNIMKLMSKQQDEQRK